VEEKRRNKEKTNQTSRRISYPEQIRFFANSLMLFLCIRPSPPCSTSSNVLLLLLQRHARLLQKIGRLSFYRRRVRMYALGFVCSFWVVFPFSEKGILNNKKDLNKKDPGRLNGIAII